MTALEEKLAEAVRQVPVLYDKSCRDFEDKSKKRLARENVAKQIKLQTGMYCSSEYSFICLMFSLVRIMLLYSSRFTRFFRVVITVVFCLLRGDLRGKNIATFGRMRDGSYAESEAYNSASVLPIHTRSELSSDSDSASSLPSLV